MHDPRLGRFFSVDPLAADYAYNSPYAFSENRVMDGVELEGLEWESINGGEDYRWVAQRDEAGNYIRPEGTVSNATVHKPDGTKVIYSTLGLNSDPTGQIDIYNSKDEISSSYRFSSQGEASYKDRSGEYKSILWPKTTISWSPSREFQIDYVPLSAAGADVALAMDQSILRQLSDNMAPRNLPLESYGLGPLEFFIGRGVFQGGTSLLRSAFTSPSTVGRVFWSGGDLAKNAAMEFAKASGRKTLEMTTSGRIMNTLNPIFPRSVSSPIWRRLSTNFAKGAKGTLSP